MKNRQSYILLKKQLKKFDFSMLLAIMILSAISMIFVYSATKQKWGNTFLIKEIVWISVGFIMFLITSFINYKNYAKFSKIIYALNILLLLSVLILGRVINGAKSWLVFGPFQIQPAEFAKVMILLTFAELLSNGMPNGVRGWKGITKCILHVAIPVLLILKQPDFGTAMVFVFMMLVLIFLHDVHLGPVIFSAVSAFLMMPITYFFILKPYQKTRIDMFLNHLFLNIDYGFKEGGWQVANSIIAIGSGGLTGKGVFHGTQNQLRFIPEPQTDFIFTVILEEAGFVGGLLVVLLFSWLLYRIISIGMRSEDKFGQFICYGAAAIIFIHTAVNMGMIMGIMPVTGIPLMFLSYGGSAFVAVFTMLGIINSIGMNSVKN